MPVRTSTRCGVVDLGSNSVRLVIFEGNRRNPTAIFNEKAVLRLGQGLQETGLLNPLAMRQAFVVMHRYYQIARAMHADPFEVLATAAVRDARNGADFVAQLQAQLPVVSIQILSGLQEAQYSTEGLFCGKPNADGVLADIGGGSLEVVGLTNGHFSQSQTLRLGVISLCERSRGSMPSARAIVDSEIGSVSWLSQAVDRDLYLVGGAWRGLARIHMAQVGYVLPMVHHYTVARDEARDLAGLIVNANRRVLERLPGVPRRRIDDLPFAALVLRRLLRVTGARRIIFSASGLREGWFMRRMPLEVRQQDPLVASGREMAEQFGRDVNLPPALVEWTAPLFPVETSSNCKLRKVACWLSDVGSHDHPEFRAEHAFNRVLRQPGMALDHQSRAFLALAIALRYEADTSASFLRPAYLLLDADTAGHAEVLGIALRLAYTLSGGTLALLAGTELRLSPPNLSLNLRENSGVFAGESVIRRLERLSQALGLRAEVRVHSSC